MDTGNDNDTATQETKSETIRRAEEADAVLTARGLPATERKPYFESLEWRKVRRFDQP